MRQGESSGYVLNYKLTQHEKSKVFWKFYFQSSWDLRNAENLIIALITLTKIITDYQKLAIPMRRAI